MTDTPFALPPTVPSAAPAERLAQRLRDQPYDLIDVRRLMRLFQASATDFYDITLI